MYDTLLIVDDLAINRSVLASLFDDSYTILEAESGEEALKIIETCHGHIDIIILDLYMPGMSGFDLLEKRQADEKFGNIPVVVITSSNAEEDQVRAFELGASDYIAKPFKPEIVSYRVGNVLAAAKRFANITKKRAKQQYSSEIDELTGVYNRESSETLISKIIENDDISMHALIIFDVDNFKNVNDNNGHLIGDHTLKILADLIGSYFRKTDIVGRIGGDEFVALMTNIPDKDIARRNVANIVRLLKYKPNLTIPANVSISVGMAFKDRKGISYAQLLDMTRETLNDAKNSGKSQYKEYGTITQDSDISDNMMVLCSRDRFVCNIISGVTENIINLSERSSIEQTAITLRDHSDNVSFIFIDMSVSNDNGEKIWKYINSHQEFNDVPVVAICEEGNMRQYKLAVDNNVMDIISMPLDASVVRRRLLHYMEY